MIGLFDSTLYSYHSIYVLYYLLYVELLYSIRSTIICSFLSSFQACCIPSLLNWLSCCMFQLLSCSGYLHHSAAPQLLELLHVSSIKLYRASTSKQPHTHPIVSGSISPLFRFSEFLLLKRSASQLLSRSTSTVHN